MAVTSGGDITFPALSAEGGWSLVTSGGAVTFLALAVKGGPSPTPGLEIVLPRRRGKRIVGSARGFQLWR